MRRIARKVPITGGGLPSGRRSARGRANSIKVRKNGKKAVDAKSTMTLPITMPLQRILRPQAAFRWILPSLAAITPQYIEMILRGALAGNHVQQWELFDLMLDTWPELSACCNELGDGVARKKMIFEPFHEEDEEPTPNAIDRSRLVSCALRSIDPDPTRDENSLDGTIDDILDGWFRGVTVLEILWQTIDTRDQGAILAPKSTFWVHPVSFAFNQDGMLGLRTGGQNLNSTTYGQPMPDVLEQFPEHKFLIGIHKAKSGTALSGPLLRPLAWWWCAANFSADWLLNLAQIFGLPFRWANYASGASDETINAISTMLQNMGSAGWAAFPEGTTLELKEASKQGDQSPQGDLLDRADRYARLLILGQTMTGATQRAGKGGQAFGEVEERVKEDRIDAAGKYVCDVLNRQLIKSILILNYGDANEAPTVRFLEEEEGKLYDAQRDAALAKMGMPIGVNFLRKKYGIPEPAKDEQIIGGIVPTPGEPGVGAEKTPGEPNAADTPPAPDDEEQQQEKNVQARLEKISKIENDEVFAKELRTFVAEIVIKGKPK